MILHKPTKHNCSFCELKMLASYRIVISLYTCLMFPPMENRDITEDYDKLIPESVTNMALLVLCSVILLPIAITFYVTWWFIHFVDGFFSPIYAHLGLNIFGQY